LWEAIRDIQLWAQGRYQELPPSLEGEVDEEVMVAIGSALSLCDTAAPTGVQLPQCVGFQHFQYQ